MRLVLDEICWIWSHENTRENCRRPHVPMRMTLPTVTYFFENILKKKLRESKPIFAKGFIYTITDKYGTRNYQGQVFHCNKHRLHYCLIFWCKCIAWYSYLHYFHRYSKKKIWDSNQKYVFYRLFFLQKTFIFKKIVSIDIVCYSNSLP